MIQNLQLGNSTKKKREFVFQCVNLFAIYKNNCHNF